MSSRLPEVTFQTHNSTDPYNEASGATTTTTIPTSTTSREPHAAVAKLNSTEKTATTGTTTPAEASTTTTPTVKTAGSATETTNKSADLIATNYRGTKTLTETHEGVIPIATAAPTTPATTALDVAHLCPPLKPGSYASSHRTKIGRWRTC